MLCTYLWPAATNVVCGLHHPSPVIDNAPPFIELSIAENRLCRRVLCVNGVGASERHFDKICIAFMAFIRGYFCLAIDLSPNAMNVPILV